LRIPAPRAVRPGDREGDRPDGRDPLGRRGLRPLRRRPDGRPGRQRGRPVPPPRPRRRRRPGAPGAGAAGGAEHGPSGPRGGAGGGAQEFGFPLAWGRAPGDVSSYAPASDRLERWTASETGGLDPSRLAEPELIHYPTFDGRPIPAFVYRPGPQFSGPRPVLI